MSSTDRPVQTRPTVAQREAAEELLRRAAGDGLLTLEEYGERVAVVLAAETHDDLRTATADLPAVQPDSAPATSRRRAPRRWLVAILGGHEESGRWRPAPTTTALAIMGGVKADLREAEVEDGELTLDAIALMGGIEIVVPEGVEVEMTGFAFMGGRERKVGQPQSPSAPLLRVRAYALMGGVEVRNPNKKERAADSGSGAIAASEYTPSTWSRSDAARRQQHRESWWGKLVGAAAGVALLAFLWNGPLNIGTADALAVFGGNTYMPSEAQPQEPVEATAVFGGVEIVIPDGYAVDVQRPLALFGGVDTDQVRAINERAGDNPQGTIVVRPRALFGGVEITGENLEEQDQD